MSLTRYSKDHLWVRIEDDIAVIGLSEYAQDALGELVFIELPEVGRDLEAGDVCAVVESDKTTTDLYAPLAGKVVEVNPAVAEEPALANKDAEGEAWFFKLEPTDPDAVDEMLDETEYTAFLEAQD
jgi:glycine cleavage system H protein